MPSFPGFTLPDELRILREQIRRFIREEIVPLEQRIDPDAPGIPDEDFERLSAKTKAAGLWALGAPEEYGGGGLDTFSMCVVLRGDVAAPHGALQPGLRRVRPLSAAGDLGRDARRRSRSTRCPRSARAGGRSSPSPSRRAARIPPARSSAAPSGAATSGC